MLLLALAGLLTLGEGAAPRHERPPAVSRALGCAALAAAVGVAASTPAVVPLALGGLGKGLAAQLLVQDVARRNPAGLVPARMMPVLVELGRPNTERNWAWALAGSAAFTAVNMPAAVVSGVVLMMVLSAVTDGMGTRMCWGTPESRRPPPLVWLALALAPPALVGLMPAAVAPSVAGLLMLAVGFGLLPHLGMLAAFSTPEWQLASKRAAMVQSASWPVTFLLTLWVGAAALAVGFAVVRALLAPGDA
jgi:hypothetical protein